MGVTLLVFTLLAQSPASSGQTIGAVEVRLPAGADARLLDRVPQLVTIRRGQVLSRKAVSRTIESLFATGKFADIEVLTEDGPGGVSVVFNLTPRLNIGVLYVEGNRALTREEVLAATTLEAGSEYWPERLELAADNVRALYRKRGYRAVDVRTEAVTIEGAMTVTFVVTEAAPTRVRSVVLSGEPGLPLARVLEALKVNPGSVLDLSLLDAGLENVRALYRKERFYRARIDTPEVSDDGTIVIPVVSGPRYDVVFSGNSVVSDSGLRALLRYEGDETLDGSLAQRLAQRVETFYRFRGYHDVRVRASETRRPSGEAALGFAIEEGDPLRVVEVTFEGAQAVSATELRDVLTRVVEASAPVVPFELHPEGDALDLAGHQPPVFAESLPEAPPDTVFEESAWANASRAMVALYRERGYLTASVTFAGAELRDGQARARFVVDEGPRAHFHSVDVKGMPETFDSETLAVSRIGENFSPGEAERLQQELARELGRKGYLFATVDVTYTLDETGENADARVTVTHGPQVKVRAVLPVGQVRTAEEVILRQATMKEGLPLDAESLYQTQSNLAGLNIFRTVQVEMLSPDRPEPLKTIVLRVHERPLFAAEGFLGYFYADGIRGGVEGTVSNIGGRGITLTGRALGNLFFTSVPVLGGQIDLSGLEIYKQLGFRTNLTLDARSVLPAGLGLRFDVIGERVFRPQFRFSRVAGIPTLDWSHVFEVPRLPWLRPKLTLALQYELEWSYVESLGLALTALPPTSLADQERLRFLFGEFTLQSGRLSTTLDLRDNALVPHKGVLLQGSGELTGAISATDAQGNPVTVNFAKVSGLATGYVPLGERFVLALSVRAGRIFPLTAGSTTPPVRRFFLGGATSMRGFNEDQLIAEDVRATYRAQVRDCQILAAKDGCSSAAKTVLAGRQVPSQGGELFALFKSELRFPAFASLDLGVFFEMGNLWLAVPTALSFRPIVGAGLRYVTPIGPIAVDVGANLTPDVLINEPPVVVHFNIGVF